MASTVASSLTKIRNLRDFKLSRKSVSKRFQKYYVSTSSHILPHIQYRDSVGDMHCKCTNNLGKKSFGDIIFFITVR